MYRQPTPSRSGSVSEEAGLTLTLAWERTSNWCMTGLGNFGSQKGASWLSVSVRVRVSGFRPHQETPWAADNLPKLHPLRCPRGLVLCGELSVSVCLLPVAPGRPSPHTFFSRQNREGQPGRVNSTLVHQVLGYCFGAKWLIRLMIAF